VFSSVGRDERHEEGDEERRGGHGGQREVRAERHRHRDRRERDDEEDRGALDALRLVLDFVAEPPPARADERGAAVGDGEDEDRGGVEPRARVREDPHERDRERVVLRAAALPAHAVDAAEEPEAPPREEE
jgi:hypothetical protein